MPTRPRGTLQVMLFAAAVAIVFGAAVSLVSVGLAPRQAENERRERQAVLASMLACQPALAGLLADQVGDDTSVLHARVVDLDSGCYVPGLEAADLDVEADAAGPIEPRALRPEEDIASIGTRPKRAVVYEVRRAGDLVVLVLPVFGQGYQSRLEGYLSLEADLDTVSSLVFHSHGETPGMGARIGDPEWQARWCGKRTRDEAGQLRIGVRLRDVDEFSPWEIDAMTGATRTGRGVTNLLRFWLGDLGFAPLIGNLRAGAACVEAQG